MQLDKPQRMLGRRCLPSSMQHQPCPHHSLLYGLQLRHHREYRMSLLGVLLGRTCHPCSWGLHSSPRPWHQQAQALACLSLAIQLRSSSSSSLARW